MPPSRPATPLFEKVEPQPAYRLLADQLTEEILAGRIKPGESLPTEMDLAEQFGVHRSTVREGIRLLEETGMLRRRSQKRLVVSVPDGGRLAERSAQALLMRRITVRSLYEANLAIDPVIARIAAEKASDAQLERLNENVAATLKARGDTQELIRLDAQFHMLLCEASNNVIFPVVRQPLHDLFMPMIGDLIRSIDTSERMITAHREILTALEARNPEQAETWARRHIEDFKRGYLKAGLDFDTIVAHEPERKP